MNDDIEIIEDEFIIIDDDEPDYDAIYDEQRLQELDKFEKSLDFKLTKTIKYYEYGDYEKTETYDENNNLIASTFGHKPITIKKEI